MISGPATSLAALRQLIDERFPTAGRTPGGVLATGLPSIDEPAGGLPRPGLTEVVCSAPSCGSQLLLGQLLQITRAQSRRVALLDRHHHFSPDSWPAHLLDHLVWVRTRDTEQTLAAGDLLVRDANLSLVVFDLRGAPPAELRRIPSTRWYRILRGLEPAALCGLVFTPFALVPSASLRLELRTPHTLAQHRQARPEITQALEPHFLRQRAAAARAG